MIEGGSSVPAIDLEVRVRLDCDRGLIEARRQGRQLAMRCGFTYADRAIITAIVSELGRNILLYATSGEMLMKVVAENSRTGILVAACDKGPGIADLSQAMRDGYSTSGRLGIGLPGVKRLADEFDVDSDPQRGTTVVVRKWRT
jgi:serine/threonine-protein kinase RsbT